MLMAQLRGKLPSEVWVGSEDLLTSAVFGMLKYLPATAVHQLMAQAIPLEGTTAPVLSGPLTWHFWPWWDTCEPDVVIEDNQTICVIEAKLYAEFGESDVVGNQLHRQWNDGSRRAQQTGRDLWLVAVTNHGTLPATAIRRQLAASDADHARVAWLSWLHIGQFLRQRRAMAPEICEDLLELLSRMGLAPFSGFDDAVDCCVGLPFERLLWADELGSGSNERQRAWVSFSSAVEMAASLPRASEASWRFSSQSSRE